MIKKSTYTRALEACTDFFAETGQVPTIDAIKPLIGVNSPSTISSAIKEWKLSLATTVKNDQGALPGVPEALSEAMKGCWQLALAEARQVFNEKAEQLKTRQTALEEQETLLKAESERIQQLLQLSEKAFQDEIKHLQQDNDRLTNDNQHLLKQTEQYRLLAIEVEKTNAVLTESIRQEHDKVNRLTLQYDKEHEWALKRIEEEKDSHRLQTQQEMRAYQAETKRYKHDLEIMQAKFEAANTMNEQIRDRITALERQLSDEKLKLAEMTLQKANLQNEINAKFKRVRILDTNQSVKNYWKK